MYVVYASHLVALLPLLFSRVGSNRSNFGEAAAGTPGDGSDHVVQQAAIIVVTIMSPTIFRVVVVVVVVVVVKQN